MNGPTLEQALLGLMVFLVFVAIGRAVAVWIGWV